MTLLLGGVSAFSQTIGSGNWSNAANWGGILPPNNGTASIVTKNTTTMDGSWDVNSVSWNASSLAGGIVTINKPVATNPSLTLRGSMTNASGGAAYIYPAIVLTGNQTIYDSGNSTTLYGAVSGLGGIIKTGAGRLVLDAVNTYSGGTVINAGAIEARQAESLGSGAVTINNAVLRFAKASLINLNTVLNANLTLGTGTGIIQMRYGALTFGQPISGPGQLQLDYDPTRGSFTQALYNISGVNSYSGGTVVGAVTLAVTGTEQSLGSSGVLLQKDGVLSLVSSSNLAPNSKIAMQKGSVLVLAGHDLDPANLVDPDPQKTTGGIIALSGTYSQPLNMAEVGSGNLYLGASGNASYTAATLEPGTGGVYRLGGGSLHQTSSQGILVFEGNPNLFTGSTSLVIGNTDVSTSSQATGSANIVLKNANNYLGGTSLISGTLTLGSPSSIGSGALTIYNGKLAVEDSVGPQTLSNAIVFASPSIYTSLTIQVPTGFSLSGPLNLGGMKRVLWGYSGLEVILSNTISNGGLSIQGGGWTLEGQNTFSGGLEISEDSILKVSSDVNLGAIGGNLTLNRGTLKATASFSTNRTVTAQYGKSTLMLEGVELALTGIFTASGDASLKKTGNGTLVFRGNSPSGFFTITAGTLHLDNTTSPTTLSAFVDTGATLTGTGYTGSIYAGPGSRIVPGNAGTGTLIVSAGNYLELGGNSHLIYDLGVTSSDRILLSGQMDKWSGAQSGQVIIDVNDAGGLAGGQTYNLIDWSESGSSSMTVEDFQLGNSPIGGRFQIVSNMLQFVTISLEATFDSVQGSSVLHAVSGGSVSIMLTASGGTQPYTWELVGGTLPAGLALGSDGVLAGSTNQTGNYLFSVQITDANGGRDSHTYSLTVGELPADFAATVVQSSGGAMVLTWPSFAGLWYQVEVSSDLVNWTPAGNPSMAVAETMAWTDDGTQTGQLPASVPCRFYRVKRFVYPP